MLFKMLCLSGFKSLLIKWHNEKIRHKPDIPFTEKLQGFGGEDYNFTGFC